jgi:hypothetical protein
MSVIHTPTTHKTSSAIFCQRIGSDELQSSNPPYHKGTVEEKYTQIFVNVLFHGK